MLKDKNEIPMEAITPKEAFGRRLSICQGFSLSRHNGMILYQLYEDMWCPEPVIGLGLVEPPEFFIKGYLRYPDSVESLEAGETWAREFPRFNLEEYIGLVYSPLTKITFDPDVIIIYCNSIQLTKILEGLEYKAERGRDIDVRISPHAPYVYALVLPIRSGKCQLSIPCGGSRRHAGIHDDELIFSIPKEKLEDFILGLEKTNASYPLELEKDLEYPLSSSYLKLASLMGIKKG